MSKKLNETIGAVEYDGLIVDTVPHTDVVHVTLAAGNGIVKRGTLITGTAGGEMAPVAAALVATKATYILADDTDVTEAAVAVAYRAGHFARTKLITAGDYAITKADEEILRNAGILLAEAL